MKLKSIASNMTEVSAFPVTVLFSYETPVAAHVRDEGYYRTELYWSNTTSRHINKWLDGRTAQEKPQSWFDQFIVASASASASV